MEKNRKRRRKVRQHVTIPNSTSTSTPRISIPQPASVPSGRSSGDTRIHSIRKMASSASSLSSIASDDISDHDHDHDTKQFLSPGNGHGASASHAIPPSKRRRTGVRSWDGNSTPISTGVPDDVAPPSPSASISSDTSGEIVHTPATLAMLGATQEDDYSGQGNDQVTECRWEGCDAGDLAHMDALVHHIHQDHIGSRQKKYSCEWADCNRKGQTHASGYALRAHMRSHTREKPFYCSLPGALSLSPLPVLYPDYGTGANDEKNAIAASLAQTH